MIILVGAYAASKTTISISAAAQNLPEGIDVCLEGTFTLLENDSNYTTTLSAALNEIGRFYIYSAEQV